MYLRLNQSVVKTLLILTFSTLGFPLVTTMANAYSVGEFDAVETSEEKNLNEIRDQEINQLKIVLGRRDSQNRRPDLMLRIAELYMEKYRHYFFKENEIYQ